MRKLRLVEEYRDRRIVTDGKLYGVQAELITDGRYSHVAGARAAIDSELGIARRKKDLEQHRAALAEYIAREGHTWTFACNCGWRGGYNELKKAAPPVFFSCPACLSNCLIFSMGTISEDAVGAQNKGPRTKNAKRRPVR